MAASTSRQMNSDAGKTMAIRITLRRRIAAALMRTPAMVATFMVSATICAAEPPRYLALAPLSDYVAADEPWEEPPVPIQPPANINQSAEPSLEQRVAELEQYIRELEAERESPDESLPDAPASKAAENEVAKDECTRQDIVVKPTFTPIGRIYFDGVIYDDDDETADFFNTDRDNELGFRTFRIGGRGNIWENLAYSLEFEIRGGPNSITYKDIWIEQQNLPWIGRLRAGHFKEPIGLEEFGSDLFNTFMEKTPATQAFAPSRNFGVMIWDHLDPCQDLTCFAGLFRADSPDTPNNSGLWRSDDNDWSFATRAAWLPFYDEPSNGRYLWHLGGSYNYRHIGGLTPGAILSGAHEQRRDVPGRLRVCLIFPDWRKPCVSQGNENH
jgi:hypothetical protein